MKTLENKVVVITGAGSGIGRALALRAAKQGAVLAISDWNKEGLAETERAIGASRIVSRQVDVRSEAEVKAFAAEVDKELGGAHVIVNNAGVSLSDTIGSMKRTDFEWLFDINFWGVVRGTEAFLPQLRAKDEGHVVNVSSVFGLVAIPSQSAYNAAKFAVRGWTEALRQELWESKVHVTCVHPGGVRTNIVKNGRIVTNTYGEPAAFDAMVSGFAKMAPTSADRAAEIIWDGVLANAPRVLVGPDAHVIDFVQRVFPTAYPTIFRAASRFFERTTGVRL